MISVVFYILGLKSILISVNQRPKHSLLAYSFLIVDSLKGA